MTAGQTMSHPLQPSITELKMTQVYDMARRILIQEKNNSTVVKSNERIFNGPRLLFLFFAKKATFGRFSPKIYDFFSAVGILR